MVSLQFSLPTPRKGTGSKVESLSHTTAARRARAATMRSSLGAFGAVTSATVFLFTALALRRGRVLGSRWLVSLLSLRGCAAAASPLASPLTAHVLRLLPGDDLVQALIGHCNEHKLSAACVLSCVGSLGSVTLRMAAAQEVVTFTEELEIVSLVGTVCADREHHLHCSVSRRDGSVLGGHCKGPAPVRTTAEIVIGVLPSLTFAREFDDVTGYKELQIRRASE